MIDFNYYNQLGFQNPFFIKQNDKLITNSNHLRLLEVKEGKNHLDFAAIVQLLNKGFILGDRTLIQGVNKTPWMGKLNEDKSDWEFFNLPSHEEKEFNEKEIAEYFYSLLKQEMLQYIKKFSQIGILLTGGMDSRIVACVLNDLIENGEVSKKQVTAITWGKKDSRDVIYASKIAKLFKWEWIHLTVDAAELSKNIETALSIGCEVSPIHLHAMSKVADLEGIDCILAGSFGDSIGRGEYSGVHVENLKTLNSNFRNIGGLLRHDFYELSKIKIDQDINHYHNIFPQQKQYQQFEQDYQLHYMRRMLNPCFSIIDKKIPVYQMFTAPEVFGYMWSIHPKLRNDNIYKSILQTKNTALYRIPWARTGLLFPDKTGTPDQYSKQHHNYGEIIRNELFPEMREKILNGPLEELNIFNMKSIRNLLKFCSLTPIKGSFFYEEKLIWIAALSDFIEKHEVTSDLNPCRGSMRSMATNHVEYYGKYFKN